MKILTHAVHTSYEYELAKTGHDFYSLDLGGQNKWWDDWARPKPANYFSIDIEQARQQDWDCIIVHSLDKYELFKEFKAPIILKLHTMPHYTVLDPALLNRVEFIVFNNREAQKRVENIPQHQSIVIEHSIDTDLYCGWKPSKNKKYVLSVCNKMPIRTDKGKDILEEMAYELDITLCGEGNEEMNKFIKKVQSKDICDLVKIYQGASVFFNPANTLPMSSLEAMAVGIPIVTMPPSNSKDLIVQGVNGIIVKDAEEAVFQIKRLLEFPCIAESIGKRARYSIQNRYQPERFVKEWEDIFKTILNKNNNYKEDFLNEKNKVFGM